MDLSNGVLRSRTSLVQEKKSKKLPESLFFSLQEEMQEDVGSHAVYHLASNVDLIPP
jgi:histidine ammonia-lyase